MGRRHLIAVLICVGLAAGCGQSPSSPSSASSTSSSAATQSAVMSAMSQAMGQAALAGRTTLDGNTVTVPCSGGGSTVITISALPQGPTEILRSSSRIEFRDCRNQAVTINGDPYLESSMELLFSSPGGALSGNSTSTIRTTGGVRISSDGVQGRVQFNCTTTVSITMVTGASPQISASSSGTTTFEQPLGSTPVTRPCGPS